MSRGAWVAIGAGALCAALALGVRWAVNPASVVATSPDVAAAPAAVPVVDSLNDALAAAPGDTASEAAGAALEPAVASPIIDNVARPYVDVTAIGRGPLDEAAFEALAERLRDDPDLLAALIDEARSESDPERLQRLLLLLGEVDDPAVVALATEFVYGGDEALRLLGLDLLKRVRPGDPDALLVVSSLLTAESEGRILVPTLTALARPGNVDAATRASLAGQVALLVDHPDASVRRTSIDILSRWSDDATYTPQLLAGLSDVDARVRETAAFAFVDHEDSSAPVRRELFALADDGRAGEAARRGAVLALKRMPLEEDERARVLGIERALDTRPLR